MSAVERGIVLDAETILIRQDGWLIYRNDHLLGPFASLFPGDVLRYLPTPTGLRRVAELVAAHDEAEADAEVLRGIADWVLAGDNAAQAVNDDLNVIADRIDERRAKAIDPRLVAAAHEQWADTEGEST